MKWKIYTIYNPVVLFKQQGEVPNISCRNLKKEDLLLVIQTDFQRDMLCRHGKKGVCIDATYRINDCDFTLMDFKEWIPIYHVGNI